MYFILILTELFWTHNWKLKAMILSVFWRYPIVLWPHCFCRETCCHCDHYSFVEDLNFLFHCFQDLPFDVCSFTMIWVPLNFFLFINLGIHWHPLWKVHSHYFLKYCLSFILFVLLSGTLIRSLFDLISWCLSYNFYPSFLLSLHFG